MNTAKLVKTLKEGYAGNTREVYELSSPITLQKTKQSSNYVLVSKLDNRFAQETYVFLSDKDGELLNKRELDCSAKGILDVGYILKRAGYELVN